MHLPFPFLNRAGHPHVPPGTTPQMGRHHVLLVGPATLVPMLRSALATEGPHIDATETAWLGRALAARYAYDLIVVDRPSDAQGRALKNSRVRCRQQGFTETRFSFCRLDDLLCVYAGGWNRKRPRDHLFSLQGSVAWNDYFVLIATFDCEQRSSALTRYDFG